MSLAGPGPLVPKVSRSPLRRLVIPRRGHFPAVPLVGATTPGIDFVCQDFSGQVSKVSYAGTANPVAYGGTRETVSYGGTAQLVRYGGTASICGR